MLVDWYPVNWYLVDWYPVNWYLVNWELVFDCVLAIFLLTLLKSAHITDIAVKGTQGAMAEFSLCSDFVFGITQLITGDESA